jgi:sorting nexin-4
MLGDDEDVFDSVTWETPTSQPQHTALPPSGLSGGFGGGFEDEIATGSGPGFRQSADDEHRDPHEPRWEGYLRTSVRDPTKELAETKDAYVSYLVTAEVRDRVIA